MRLMQFAVPMQAEGRTDGFENVNKQGEEVISTMRMWEMGGMQSSGGGRCSGSGSVGVESSRVERRHVRGARRTG